MNNQIIFNIYCEDTNYFCYDADIEKYNSKTVYVSNDYGAIRKINRKNGIVTKENGDFLGTIKNLEVLEDAVKTHEYYKRMTK